MAQEELPGLERLLEVCRRLSLGTSTLPPGSKPPVAGSKVQGHPLDPMLAAFYARFGKAMFAKDSVGVGLFQVDDSVNELESDNEFWQETWQKRFTLPLFVFGGWSGLAWYLATVPGLADSEGHQPVVFVEAYDEPYALPVASTVDRFFECYSHYIEALVTQPDFEEYGMGALTFPWGVPELLARDARLVELLRTGRFDPLLKTDGETRAWVSKVLHAATRPEPQGRG
jgi:hypothetical protein